MVVCVDFDSTVVDNDATRFDDVRTPLVLQRSAREALLALKRAGHVLLLYSARANRAHLVDPKLDPLVRVGARPMPDPVEWEKQRELWQARFDQMVEFVNTELPGVFDAIDDGVQGKPCADLFIDDRALRFGHGLASVGWATIASMYGERMGRPLRKVA